MELTTVEYEKRGPVAYVRLNRPDKLNAINPTMIAEIDHALDQVEANDAVHALVDNFHVVSVGKHIVHT